MQAVQTTPHSLFLCVCVWDSEALERGSHFARSFYSVSVHVGNLILKLQISAVIFRSLLCVCVCIGRTIDLKLQVSVIISRPFCSPSR